MRCGGVRPGEPARRRGFALGHEVTVIFRWVALASVIGALGISVYYRHRARRTGDVVARRREGVGLMLTKAGGGLLLWGSLFAYLLNPGWMAWSVWPLPMWLRWLGVVLGLLTVPAAWWVFSSLGRNVTETVLTKADHALVTTGPYRWIRHPLYAMGGALFVAVGLMSASWFILGIGCLAVALMRVVLVPKEEQALVAKFGDEYRAYINRTGGLVPRVSVRRHSSTETSHGAQRR